MKTVIVVQLLRGFMVYLHLRLGELFRLRFFCNGRIEIVQKWVVYRFFAVAFPIHFIEKIAIVLLIASVRFHLHQASNINAATTLR